MATVVYALCAVASGLCTALLARAWAETRTPLLGWCLGCFAGLTLNNVVLFIDKVIARNVNLSTWRSLPAALGTGALLYGLIVQTRSRRR